MDNDKTLEKIRDSVEEAIRPLLKKGEAMTPADLESLTKAVCIIEKIKRIENGNFDESYSENSFDDSGNSYRRGRSSITGRYVSRDAYHDGGSYGYHDSASTGGSYGYHDGASTRRYYDGGSSARSYGGNSMSRDYSGHSIQDRMIDRLERMMDEAQSENERQTVRDWINRLRR